MASPELDNPLGGQRHYTTWRGHEIAYTVRGEGPPMLLVHSIHACAWNMEWRLAVPTLAAHFTTYSIDLLGFGASDRPPVDYSAKLYIELLGHMLREVIGTETVLVGSSLGATYAIAAAAFQPELVKAVVAVGPAGLGRLDKPGGAGTGMIQSVFRSPSVGSRLFAALSSKTSIRFFLKDIYADPAMMTDALVDLYWQSARHPDARYAPAAFVGFRLTHDLSGDLQALDRPLMIVWGERAKQTPLKESKAFRAVKPEAAFLTLPGGDLPHEESADAFADAVVDFVSAHAMTPRADDAAAAPQTPPAPA